MDKILLTLPLKKQWLTTARLATGGVCSAAGLGVDDGEDCKLCVTESLLLLHRKGYTTARISFYKENAWKAEILGSGQTGEYAPSEEEEISVALLSALVKDLQMTNGEEGYLISFEFGA